MAVSNMNCAVNDLSYSRWFNNKQNSCNYDEDKQGKISEMKRLLNGSQNNDNRPKSIIESSLSYGKSLRESRNAAKNTATEIKKLKYNFKDISSQLRRSKTSTNAKQVASKARREVIQLKMKLQSGNYDEEELTAAIEHAKSMERAAKKKARHLEEEELIKITDKEGYDTSLSDFEAKLEEQSDRAYEKYEQIAEEIEQSMEARMEEAQIEELSEEMYAMMSESLESMIEESLGDLSDSMMMVTDFEMNEDEFKEFKLKHRQSEEKAMLEADAKYLKALFDIYDKRMGGYDAGSSPVSPISVDMPCIDTASSIPNIVDVSL